MTENLQFLLSSKASDASAVELEWDSTDRDADERNKMRVCEKEEAKQSPRCLSLLTQAQASQGPPPFATRQNPHPPGANHLPL